MSSLMLENQIQVPTQLDTSVEAIKRAITHHLCGTVGCHPTVATPFDIYMAVAFTLRDYLMQLILQGANNLMSHPASGLKVKLVGYLSAEYLPGPLLRSNASNLGLMNHLQTALTQLGINFNDLLAEEVEPGLGNGGLGRLASCYLEAMANTGIPAIGYGIFYEFGLFKQEVQQGQQRELTDKWLAKGYPWAIHRPNISYLIPLGGWVSYQSDPKTQILQVQWHPERMVQGVAHDVPIAGARGDEGLAIMRLWRSEAVESFDFERFNQGQYHAAVDEKIFSETLSKVLYPNDETDKGKLLRLAQQYFLVSCSLQNMIQILQTRNLSISSFHQHFAVQLNDTHPALAVLELMRLLVDVHQLSWDASWAITQQACAYTNHTLLPEALERWPVSLFARLLPRHLDIANEINRRLMNDVAERYQNHDAGVIADWQRRLSLFEEAAERQVRMAYVATHGSHHVNGVSAMHSQLLTQTVLADYAAWTPEKFCNVTNGISHRRFLQISNPALSELICDALGGDHWLKAPTALTALEAFAEDSDFLTRWAEVRAGNKFALAERIWERTQIEVNPHAVFDIQVKRIHEYKRQLLNILHVITLYRQLKSDPKARSWPPRVFIFGGKAAPGYWMAKKIIQLICSVADVINADTTLADRLKVVFYPNFNVQEAEFIYPAADISEQISLAGMEASGTGNMKFGLNGALTIATLDGANAEMLDRIGADAFYRFGMTSDEVAQLRSQGYSPQAFLAQLPELQETLSQIAQGVFSNGDAQVFESVVENLRFHDNYCVIADYADYAATQARLSQTFENLATWASQSVLNTARLGYFSADRAVMEYNQHIWHV
ncbi:MAG: glycogen/starch/alpha-glucan phosphorylase, partial [Vampirovibrionales bacterium]|nr:glycogen/starch/alpha-glucan phosphorylase [Vampirovibrionales bacterium]